MFLSYLFSSPVIWATVVFVVVASVVLHELGHAVTATWQGDPTPRLRGHFTWNPVVHMGWFALVMLAVVGWTFGRTPVNPSYFRSRRWGAVLVGIAGPAVNLFLAVVATGVLLLVERHVHVDPGARLPFLHVFWRLAATLNVSLFLLNMIPLPPLDGFSVAEGIFDLGALGARIRGFGFFPLIVAILIVNSDAFDALEDFVLMGIRATLSGALGAF